MDCFWILMETIHKFHKLFNLCSDIYAKFIWTDKLKGTAPIREGIIWLNVQNTINHIINSEHACCTIHPFIHTPYATPFRSLHLSSSLSLDINTVLSPPKYSLFFLPSSPRPCGANAPHQLPRGRIRLGQRRSAVAPPSSWRGF